MNERELHGVIQEYTEAGFRSKQVLSFALAVAENQMTETTHRSRMSSLINAAAEWKQKIDLVAPGQLTSA